MEIEKTQHGNEEAAGARRADGAHQIAARRSSHARHLHRFVPVLLPTGAAKYLSPDGDGGSLRHDGLLSASRSLIPTMVHYPLRSGVLYARGHRAGGTASSGAYTTCSTAGLSNARVLRRAAALRLIPYAGAGGLRGVFRGLAMPHAPG